REDRHGDDAAGRRQLGELDGAAVGRRDREGLARGGRHALDVEVVGPAGVGGREGNVARGAEGAEGERRQGGAAAQGAGDGADGGGGAGGVDQVAAGAPVGRGVVGERVTAGLAVDVRLADAGEGNGYSRRGAADAGAGDRAGGGRGRREVDAGTGGGVG